ncbi:metallophosphoesterase family protein [Bifidobacterium felsineum]|uniref:metallophosphoesterase family protein n=1 Tax=Bifidobacterium felsineum TaxID=2045440 RepID=UPI001BDCB080|nr:metallophosphoesterase [Bifidobacterium felsineum]MBT1164587.1 metallophosphoesterase [Bifidobacterium felsineum]
MSTLIVGDLHAKGDLLPLVSTTADRTGVDRIILLGDYCDDWTLSNNGLERFLDRFRDWIHHEPREIIPILGNHDIPYLLNHGSDSYDRVRRLAPGYKPGAHRHAHDILTGLPCRLAWTDGEVICTHAGLTRGWEREHGLEHATVGEIADWLDRRLDHAASLAALWLEIGSARGGDTIPGPLWADRMELMADGDDCLTQVVGHTPIPSITNLHGFWFCDTMSRLPDGTPIGDQSMLLYDGHGGFTPVRPYGDA